MPRVWLAESFADAERRASEAAPLADAIVAVGGDGTLQAVVNGLLATPGRPVLGVVAAGRGNDLARALGLPFDATAAIRVVLDGARRRIDVGRCGARYWLTAAGVGLDADIAARARHARRWQRGAVPYVLATLGALRRHRGRDLAIDLDGRAVVRRCAFVAVANTACYGGGMRICPEADPGDGQLDVCIVGDVGRLEILRMLPGVFTGRHAGHRAVELCRARCVRITGPPGTRAHIDGESAGTTPVELTVVPAALTVFAAIPDSRGPDPSSVS
jgi:diacylglycerol kinase (ATP)